MEHIRSSAHIGSQRERDIFLNIADQWREYYGHEEADRLSSEEWDEAMQQGLEGEGILPSQISCLNTLAKLEAQTWS